MSWEKIVGVRSGKRILVLLLAGMLLGGCGTDYTKDVESVVQQESGVQSESVV